MDKKMVRSILFLMTYGILLVLVIVKIDLVMQMLGNALSMAVPIFIGFSIAFILKRPYNFMTKVIGNLIKNEKFDKMEKPLALASVYLLFFGVVTLLLAFVIPQFTESVQLLYKNMDEYGRNFETFLMNTAKYLRLDNFDMSNLDNALDKVPDLMGSLATGIMPKIFDFTTNFLATVVNIVIGFVLSVYLLADKRHLKSQFHKAIKAYLPQEVGGKLLKVLQLSNETFTKFISGQLTEALILGVLCFTGMLVLGFEYPILISVIIGITSLVPIVGSIIGLIPALFILLMIEPIQALWFLVFIIVLQQIEGNFIYPRVVGGTIGLPPLWVLLGIIIGGGLFGVLGMLLGVPALSVIYQLLKEDIHAKTHG
ncbi:AI-2E family transporter [Petrocella sp. FN5]|uniref:AI-2E family transporter n=1 Tax=Petrocella sp. FN5 TaxID=3032002 RepID=UPI0023DB12FB|nr:AI-2E family transporter [Petrocella sp. FN5]MDF1615867.1 AI-2E family transporter [Petrocella sp. FN5]